MTLYYVATKECSVLVSADDQSGAWVEGHSALHPLHAALNERTGQDTPVDIQAIHVATTDEIANGDLNAELNSRPENVARNPVFHTTELSAQLFAAVGPDSLCARAETDSETASILILIDGTEVLRVGCLCLLDRPGARLCSDGQTVEVYPSPGLPEGFSIIFRTREQAKRIAHAVDACLEDAYMDLVDGEVAD